MRPAIGMALQRQIHVASQIKNGDRACSSMAPIRGQHGGRRPEAATGQIPFGSASAWLPAASTAFMAANVHAADRGAGKEARRLLPARREASVSL